MSLKTRGCSVVCSVSTSIVRSENEILIFARISTTSMPEQAAIADNKRALGLGPSFLLPSILNTFSSSLLSKAWPCFQVVEVFIQFYISLADVFYFEICFLMSTVSFFQTHAAVPGNSAYCKYGIEKVNNHLNAQIVQQILQTFVSQDLLIYQFQHAPHSH